MVVISSGQTVRVIPRSRHFSRPGWAGVCRPAPAILRRIWLVRSLGDPATAAAALKPSLVVVVGHMDRLRGLAAAAVTPGRSPRAEWNRTNSAMVPFSNSTADAKCHLSRELDLNLQTCRPFPNR